MASLTRDTLADFLRAQMYFESLKEEHLRWLAEQCQRRTYAADETIFLEGEAAQGMWLIEEGRVKIFKINPEGEEHIMHLLSSGNTFNDIPAFDGGSNPANAGTLTETTLWVLPSEALKHILTVDKTFALKVIKMLATRVR